MRLHILTYFTFTPLPTHIFTFTPLPTHIFTFTSLPTHIFTFTSLPTHIFTFTPPPTPHIFTFTRPSHTSPSHSPLPPHLHIHPLTHISFTFTPPPPPPQLEETQSIKATLQRFWRDEGIRGLKKGLSARIISSTSTSAILVVSYEWVKRMSLRTDMWLCVCTSCKEKSINNIYYTVVSWNILILYLIPLGGSYNN